MLRAQQGENENEKASASAWEKQFVYGCKKADEGLDGEIETTDDGPRRVLI